MQSENDKEHHVKCTCGKTCNGNRGLRAHQRFCQISDIPELRDLFHNELLRNEDNFIDYHDDPNDTDPYIPEIGPLKTGLKLPKTKEGWSEANEYFKFVYDINFIDDNIDNKILHIQDQVYDYFKQKYGVISNDTINIELSDRYSELSKRQLKKKLTELKENARSSET